MSLYNMICGKNPISGILLDLLGTNEGGVPRFRDCWLGDDGKTIVIYTRTGGGNRDYYDHVERHKRNCDYGECKHEGPYNSDLRALPGFKYDEDDDFDSTYAHFHYEMPEAVQEMVGAMRALNDPDRGGKAFHEVITKMQAGDTSDPRIVRALEVGKKIMGSLDAAVKSGESAVITV